MGMVLYIAELTIENVTLPPISASWNRVNQECLEVMTKTIPKKPDTESFVSYLYLTALQIK